MTIDYIEGSGLCDSIILNPRGLIYLTAQRKHMKIQRNYNTWTVPEEIVLSN